MAAAVVTMPRLSDSMEEGTIVRWLKHDGDQVAVGEEIVEIETDKATMGYEAEASGPLAVLAPEGQTLPVGAVIARIGEVGARVVSGASPEIRASPEVRLRVSPVARRLAQELNVELGSVAPTGPAGRIVKRDVLAAAPAKRELPATAGSGAAASARSAPGTADRRPLTATQTTIARRMVEARAIPAFTATTEVEMDATLALRAELEALSDGGDAPISTTS